MITLVPVLAVSAAAGLFAFLAWPRKKKETELDRMKRICTQAIVDQRARVEHNKKALNNVDLYEQDTKLDKLKRKYFAIPHKQRKSDKARQLAGQINALGGRVWAIDAQGDIEYIQYRKL